MSGSDQFTANVLRHGSRACAAFAANELLQECPEVASVFVSDPHAGWARWMQDRIDDLVVAIALDRPELLISQIDWTRSQMAAKGAEDQHLQAALRCLDRMLQQQLPSEAGTTTQRYLADALASFEYAARGETPITAETPESRLAASYLLALLEGDSPRASQLLLSACKNGENVGQLYENVILPALREIGRMWLADEINIAEEHFTTSVTKTVLAQLRQLGDPSPDTGNVVLTAAIEGNEHDVGPQMVSELFHLAGWRVIHLGASVPVADLAQSVLDFAADLLILSASLSTQLLALRDTIAAVRAGERGNRVKILAGGLALADHPELAAQFGADGYAATAVEAVQLGNALVKA